MPPLPLHRIPAQTGANCALFAVIGAARLLGCDGATEAALVAQLDKLEKSDPRTFIGEVLSMDLLLELIRGLSLDGAPIFNANALAFSSPGELGALIENSVQSECALLVPFARPESYDAYYRLMAAQIRGEATEAEVTAARRCKEEETAFHPADAHWALVNRVDTAGQIVLADSFEDVWGGGHGYEATFALEKLAAANLALDGCFDWSNFLDEQGRAWGVADLLGKPYAPSAPRRKNPARLERILAGEMQERLDLAGQLIEMERNQ